VTICARIGFSFVAYSAFSVKLFDVIRDARQFTVTDEHLRLLRRACVWWDELEFGAPGIDPKRPYGNSNVFADIAEILEV